ncbi:MAG: LolA family protein [bacterium]
MPILSALYLTTALVWTQADMAPIPATLTAPLGASLAGRVPPQDIAEDLNAKALRELEEENRKATETVVTPMEDVIVETDETVTTARAPETLIDVAFADQTDEQVLHKAIEYLQGVKTLSASFLQTNMSGHIDSGSVKMERPGKVRFEYDPPNPNLIVATRNTVYLYDADLETTDSYPLKKTPLNLLLSKRIDPDAVELIRVNRQPGRVSLTLESQDEETPGQLVLEFLAPEMQLDGWAVIDNRGNVTTIALNDVKEGENIPNKEFRIPEAGGFGLKDR